MEMTVLLLERFYIKTTRHQQQIQTKMFAYLAAVTF